MYTITVTNAACVASAGYNQATDIVDINKGLRAHYPFNSTASDVSGNGFNGTMVGSGLNTITSDRFIVPNSSLNVNGANALDIATPITNEQNWTMSAWVFPISATTGAILSNFDNPYNYNIELRWEGDKFFYYDTKSGNNYAPALGGLTTNKWYHALVVSTPKSVKMYVNSQLITTTTFGGVYTPYTHKWMIGARPSTNNNEVPGLFFNGKIDAVRMYGRAVNQTEINQIYADGCPGFVASFDYGSTPFCQVSNASISGISTVTGGSFVPQFGLAINSISGVVNLAASTAGVYNVEYRIPAQYGCSSASGFNTITISGVTNTTSGTSLCDNGTDAIILGGSNVTTWSALPVGFQSNIVANVFTTSTLTGTVSVFGTNMYGCTSNTIVFDVNLSTKIVSTSLGINGILATLAVTASGTNLNYLWNNEATTASITTSVSGSYLVSVSGICGSVVSPAFVYQAFNYSLGPISPVENCSANKFKIPVVVSSVPSGIIGLAINIPFNPAVFTPTGIVTYGSVLTASGAPLRNYLTTTTVAGQVIHVINLFASSSYTGSVATGVGTVIEIEYELRAGINPQNITLTGTISESYILYSSTDIAFEPTVLSIIPNDQRYLKGILFARGATSRPVTSLGAVQTLVYGSTGTTISSTPLQTLSGNNFALSLPLGFDGIGIVRDISSATIVTPVINSNDALIVQRIANSLPPFNTSAPTVLQLMAADVNSDGRVTLSDWILIQQRVVNTITEFPVTPDWKFLESARVNTFTGQTSSNFPVVKSIVSVSPVNNANGCTTLGNRTITGILTGDVDGTWNNVTNGNTFKIQAGEELVYDLSKIIYTDTNYIRVPLLAAGFTEDVAALDVDFQYNHTKLELISVEAALASQSTSSTVYNKLNSNRLLISSLSYDKFNPLAPVLFVNFKTSTAVVKEDFTGINSYVNGRNVSSRIESVTESATNVLNTQFTIFPNPSETGVFKLNYLGKGVKSIRVFNIAGVLQKSFGTESELFYELDLQGLSFGMYFLEVVNPTEKVVKKLILK